MHLCEPNQLHEFEDLVDAADSRHPHDVCRVAAAEHIVEWEDAKQVEQEPGRQVLVSDDFAVTDNLHVVIVDCRVEDDDHVNEEQDVDDIVDPDPVSWKAVSVDRELERSNHAGEQQHREHVEIPGRFPFILGQDQALVRGLQFDRLRHRGTHFCHHLDELRRSMPLLLVVLRRLLDIYYLLFDSIPECQAFEVDPEFA